MKTHSMTTHSMKTHRLSGTSRRVRHLLAGAGLVLTGATLAAVGTALLPGTVGAQEVKGATLNYVKSANPDAVSGVLLDEELSIEFRTAVLPTSVGPDTILVRTGLNNGEQARGRYVVGAFLFDSSTQRRAVIRPEAVREYYELVKGLPRVDAERAAKSLIKKIESTGKLSLLRVVDQKLRVALGPIYGTRLDDEGVFGTYPAPLADSTPTDRDDPLTLDPGDSPLEPFRTRIAGDDTLWQSYLVNSDINAFDLLAANSEYERFYHPVDPATGAPSDSSVLRQREYRRVLINRRSGSRVMFVPELPIRADLTDTGYTPGRAYSLTVPASQPGIYNTVQNLDDGRPLVQLNGRDFSTLFTTIPSTTVALFRDGEARTGVTTLQKPRVINQTPPNGESFVDPTTDWEDPDNQFTVPIQARRTFAIRLRFAQPLDPRSISPTSFTVTKKASIDSLGNETAVSVPVAIGTFLNQHRLGIVEVEITPATNLDPASKYEVVARNLIRGLGGSSNATDYVTSFIVGPGAPPLDAIRESFTAPTNRADPKSPDTLGQITTALWPAPALFDASSSGKLAASFMQFAGTGVGAPTDPRDLSTPIVTDLDLQPGQAITYVTEQIDPANPTTLGSQIEYNYRSIKMTNATVVATGRYPLVIRSQDKIELHTAVFNLFGQSGGTGNTNAASAQATGGPTGGLGGSPGPGGYRGGDGSCSPLVDAVGQAILDANGKLQFDAAKFVGQDGAPGYLQVSGSTGGGGSGGFNGDREAANNVECAGVPTTIDKDDVACTPARLRECGGGGGHATAGGSGTGVGGSLRSHTGGYVGGIGGTTYGRSDFGDQPKNGLFGTVGVPRLGFGSGGAGGGGGGAEDGGGAGGAADKIANGFDSGGGGGGGGGGGLQLAARTSMLLESTTINVSGGLGGRTFNATLGDKGLGAPGGCGAGGSIWLQCYGDIVIQNASALNAGGGGNLDSTGVPVVVGFTTVKPDNTDPLQATPAIGLGGKGGDGYVRIEDQDGAASIDASSLAKLKGVLTQAKFAPYDNPATSAVEADFQAFPGTPFVVAFSQGFSRWFNTALDTPAYATSDDDPATPAVDGTSFFSGAGVVDIWVRSAPNDTANTGHPNLALATSSGNTAPWTRYVDVGTVSRRRFLQFRVDFTLPLSYDFDAANLPYVDFFMVKINLN